MLDETQLLCDRIQKLIDDSTALIQSDALAEKQKQLQQISISIGNLTRANVAVPQELITLSESLNMEVMQYDIAMEVLKTLFQRLNEFSDCIRPFVHAKVSRVSTRRSNLTDGLRRKRRTDVTPLRVYENHIVDILREFGGSAETRIVREKLMERMQDSMLSGDLAIGYRDEPVWVLATSRARDHLFKKGVLSKDTPRGIWKLTEGSDANTE